MAEYGTTWKLEEVRATVASYLRMLTSELKGEAYSKAAERRQLQQAIGRTSGSIEFKHQNISAVMMALGRPPIEGYKPAINYQRALYEEVIRQLDDRRDIDLLTQGWTLRRRSWDLSKSLIAVDIPEKVIEVGQSEYQERGVLRDYLAIAERNQQVGEAGEVLTLEYERSRLTREGRPDLSVRIEHVSKTRGDGLGFDIRSFNSDGSSRLIEVKATGYSAVTPFFVTRQELLASQHFDREFWLYRVHDLGRSPSVFWMRGPLDFNCTLEPANYSANVKTHRLP